ncbi:60S ribosomal protein L24 [Choanephora cucurbitarum]|uniref:60S ribosomal protein L24 n=1 Tax=Choanephora cucurbitarum TaxID=101091 RepID=A0A1C7NKM2_9FUNG|nr:60S ribosomal protein L24 [Choanephora cucurbitarum]
MNEQGNNRYKDINQFFFTGLRFVPSPVTRSILPRVRPTFVLTPGKLSKYTKTIKTNNSNSFLFSAYRTFRFINGKAASYFLQRLNPRKIRWTVIYRRLNKKGITEEVQKKRSRRTVKHERAVVGASWDAIRAKRNQKPDARAAARQAAISKSKEAKKAAVAAKKAANPAGAQAKVSKQQAKGFAPKAAATSR